MAHEFVGPLFQHEIILERFRVIDTDTGEFVCGLSYDHGQKRDPEKHWTRESAQEAVDIYNEHEIRNGRHAVYEVKELPRRWYEQEFPRKDKPWR